MKEGTLVSIWILEGPIGPFRVLSGTIWSFQMYVEQIKSLWKDILTAIANVQESDDFKIIGLKTNGE